MWRVSVEPGRRGRPRGFSLLEVLVTCALFSLVMTGVYLLYTTMQGTLARGEIKSDLQQNARVGLDRMVQELRMAGYDPENALGQITDHPFNEIRAAADGCLSFVTYRKHAGSDKSVRVTYSVSDTTLSRREDDWNQAGKVFDSSSTQPLAESVNQLTFTYYDGFNRILTPSGAVSGACPPGGPVINLVDPSESGQLRRVRIFLRMLEPRARPAPESYTLTSDVYLRNR